MGKICILYESQTGCTEAMAKLIEEGCNRIPNMEVRVRSVHDESAPDDVLWADGLAIGTPTNLGGISWRMKKFWDDWSADNWNKVDGKICCTFSSQGGHGGGAELACTAMNIVLMNFGFMVFGVTDYVDKITTLHYGACVAKSPRNPNDKEVCRVLGLRLAEWVAVFFDGRSDLHPLKTTKLLDGREVDEVKSEASITNGHAEPKSVVKEEPSKTKPEAPKATASRGVVAPTAETHPGRVQLIVRASVPWRNQTAWKAMAKELEVYTRAEPGCLHYAFGQIEGSETEFYVVEEYRRVADLDIHSNSSYFKRLVPAMGKVSSTLSVQKVFPLNPQAEKKDRSFLYGAAGLVVGIASGVALAKFVLQE
eukprot:TRINITY_DN6630_c0_g2_i1.p1 TRINITY_DN6630_c0_g2~~TRINITY_DN6630_c0_g2_i1.p1  ORF type:complete len:366 (+),score=74.10 TRINITY_DN6630_c0_g2_i1:97-1194(+)